MSTEDVEMRPEPSENDWVRIVSEEGFSFMVRRKVANTSGTLRNMLDSDSNFAEASTNTCHIPERPILVEKLCEYLTFKSYYEKIGPKEDIPIHEVLERIPPELALELLLVADYHEA